jgi:methylglutamate dehydrogenase subunit B
MRIPCPYCGERSNDEFVVKGDATALMARPASSSQDAFHEHLYLRINNAGEHRELWYHQGGCRQWLVVTRDTRTHAIFQVELARSVAPGALPVGGSAE